MKTQEQIDAAIFAQLPLRPTAILDRLCGGPFTDAEVKERFAALLHDGVIELTNDRILRRKGEQTIDLPCEAERQAVCEFEHRLLELCKEFNARLFARNGEKTAHISVVFGPQEKPWIDYKRINPDEGIVRSR